MGAVAVAVTPEWAGIWKNTKEFNAVYFLGWKAGPGEAAGGGFAWGKAKGGGLSLYNTEAPVEFHSDPSEEKGIHTRTSNNGWLFSGRRVRTHGLVIHAELNGVLGTLIEEVETGKWHVKLDDGHGEHVMRLQNLLTLSGIPLASSDPKADQTVPTILKPQVSDVKPSVEKRMASSSISITEKNNSPDGPSVPDLLCIAGTWDDWMPKDMHWDEKQGCHVYEVVLDGISDAKFGVNRGKAGTKKWNVRPKQWNLGKSPGKHQIRVFSQNRAIQKVEWEKVV